MFNKYYQDELLYLREMGREFAKAYPESGRYLAETGSDPDVERMLEGFAFLAARLRQKLDDELPELTHGLIETFWPHFLRPLPSMAVVQFEPARPSDKEHRRIPRGTAVDSVPVDGTRCRFRTVYDVHLAPLRLQGLSMRSSGGARISVEVRLAEGVAASRLGIQRLRLHCAGPHAVASAVFGCLVHRCTGVTAVAGSRRVALRPPEQVGFEPEEALLDGSQASFRGFVLLGEYFAFPAKFLFFDLTGLEALAQLGDVGAFTLEFALSDVPDHMPQIGEGNLLAACSPVVNLFPHEAVPVPVERERSEYKVVPAGEDPTHFEVYAITDVLGLTRGEAKPKEFRPLHGGRGEDGMGQYLVRRRPALLDQGTDLHLQLPGDAIGSVETLSIGLLCSNRRLPSTLGPGDIHVPTDACPPGVRFRNLAKPTASVVRALGGALEWQLLSHLSLNLRSLADAERLRELLDLYDARAAVDQQARQAHRRLVEGIEAVELRPATVISGGAPVRGLEIELRLREDHFDGDGDLQLFADVMDRFFAEYATINAFTRLVVRGVQAGNVDRRTPRIGRRRLL